ncbi:MAG: hypothetical protein N3F63_04395 [Thermoplasmata archaeon]|nr:hypothetical protein [Thermoplasmata archaeon]
MPLDNQKLIFFSAIFVVFVAVAVTVGKATYTPSTSGVMSPAQLWNAIEQGKIQNESYLVVEGIIESVDTVYAGTVPIYNLTYFKGCDAPFLWGIHDESPTDYINRRVTVVVGVMYLGEMAQGYGKDGWVAVIGEIL